MCLITKLISLDTGHGKLIRVCVGGWVYIRARVRACVRGSTRDRFSARLRFFAPLNNLLEQLHNWDMLKGMGRLGGFVILADTTSVQLCACHIFVWVPQ